MVVVSPGASRRHNRLARVLANALDAIDLTPTRPSTFSWRQRSSHPGSETTDRVVKLIPYASADIPLYWRVELTPTRIPVVYAYLLDSASRRYRDGEVHTGRVTPTVPFPVEVDLSTLA